MRPGDPVLFVAAWSSFCGMRGRVVTTAPHLMVVIGDDPRPLRVGEREVIPDGGDSQRHIGGAE